MEIVDALLAALADTTAKVVGLQKQLQDLETERRGLELAVARHQRESAVSGSPLPPRRQTVPSADTMTTDWTVLGVSDAVYRALVEAGMAQSPADLVKRLQSAGRPMEAEQVRAALSHLRRNNAAERVSYGQWVAITAENAPRATVDAENPAAEAGLSVIHPSIKEGGGADGTDSLRDHDETPNGAATHRDHPVSAPVGA